MDEEREAKLKKALADLFAALKELSELFPGRPFKPDGHPVGSLGEAYAENDYFLKLEKPSNDGFDAKNDERKTVEIKATFRNKEVNFRDKKPELLLVLQLYETGGYDEVYNGPFAPVRELIESRVGGPTWSGQQPVSLSKLRELQRPDGPCVKRRNEN
ncbi:MAG: hypothetical protein RIC14_15445 [Filomicrobium sp.]